jgi:large repetitive protein
MDPFTRHGHLSNNVAQISVGNLALGSHSITATYAGDRNFAGSTSAALPETVNPAATSTVLTSNANPILVKSTVTFTATVSSSSPGTQTGTVSFYLDGSSTAAASVNPSNGTAKYSANSLSAGSHSVVAAFNSTNSDFATSSVLTQFVSDFTVAVSPSSLTLARGTSATYTLTVTSIGEIQWYSFAFLRRRPGWHDLRGFAHAGDAEWLGPVASDGHDQRCSERV